MFRQAQSPSIKAQFICACALFLFATTVASADIVVTDVVRSVHASGDVMSFDPVGRGRWNLTKTGPNASTLWSESVSGHATEPFFWGNVFEAGSGAFQTSSFDQGKITVSGGVHNDPSPIAGRPYAYDGYAWADAATSFLTQFELTDARRSR